MAEMLKKIECDASCGFMVRSHDEQELIKVTAEHVKKFHDMNMPEKDIKAMIKQA